MKDSLVVGRQHSASITVTAALTVPALPDDILGGFPQMPPVFATAMVIAFVEGTCIELLADHLDAGEVSLGIHVDVSHEAPTVIGATATATVTVAEVAGRILWFDVEVRDEGGIVARGRHQRAVVARSAFEVNAASRAAGAG